MKKLVFALLVMAAMTPLQADILANSNFADGRAHWKGDAEEPDTGGDLSQNPSTQGGVIINLKKDKWTKIYQSFTTHEMKLHYSITFKLSPDYQPESGGREANSGFGPTPGLNDIPGVPGYYGSNRGTWRLIFAEPGRGSRSFPLRPDEKKTDAQTLTGDLHGDAGEGADMILVFAFPPGEGSITITSISLTTDDQ